MWLEAQGLPGLKPAGSLVLTGFDQVMQAALNGQGIALGPTPLVRRLITEGRLVAPLKAVTGSARAYYLLVEPGAAARPPVRAFVAWLQEQAEEEARAGTEQFYGSRRRSPAPARGRGKGRGGAR